MEITREMAKEGCVTLSRLDGESIQKVQDYNMRMRGYVARMKSIKEIQFGFFALNPLLILTVTFCFHSTVFEKGMVAGMILALLVVIMMVSFLKKNCVILTIASAFLPILNLLFWILLLVNILLNSMLYYMEKPLRREPGYPDFQQIKIYFEE